MFTGIIETLGTIEKIVAQGDNLNFTISSSISHTLKIDQSVAHNGVCLTVVAQEGNTHEVTAIKETLQKTNFSTLKIKDVLNLERAMKLGDRLDGHLVQGHVDSTAQCVDMKQNEGSWEFRFLHEQVDGLVTVPKGSICVNGISLTVVDSTLSEFSVAIIPYTYEHTNIQFLSIGSLVNIEFDILGKYFWRYGKVYFGK